MTKQHVTKHKDGDGSWHEVKTTHYPDGSSKSVKSDITERTVLGGDKVESVTRTDSHGNSRTETYRR